MFAARLRGIRAYVKEHEMHQERANDEERRHGDGKSKRMDDINLHLDLSVIICAVRSWCARSRVTQAGSPPCVFPRTDASCSLAAGTSLSSTGQRTRAR